MPLRGTRFFVGRWPKYFLHGPNDLQFMSVRTKTSIRLSVFTKSLYMI